MKRLVFESWCLLLYVDMLMRLRDFRTLRSQLRDKEVSPSMGPDSAMLNRAMDLAVVFYFKRVQCLQRSTATALLLRRYGHPAQIVIGVEMHPFQSHAWVELQGLVLNDKPYVREIYREIDRY